MRAAPKHRLPFNPWEGIAPSNAGTKHLGSGQTVQTGRVDHDGAAFGLGAGQALHHPDEDASLTSSLPAVVEGLVRPVGRQRIPPAQAVAIDEDDPAQHTAVIHPRLAVALGAEGAPAEPSARPSANTGRSYSDSSGT